VNDATTTERLWLFWDAAGTPYVGVWRAGERVRLRDATDADRRAVYAGRLSYDAQTDPTREAWERLASGGG
jgi:hypothetical protein